MARYKETKKKDLHEIVELFVPFNEADRKDKSIIVSVNGDARQLERGMTHKVPLYIKREYERKQKMISRRNDYIEKVKKEMEEKHRETGTTV